MAFLSFGRADVCFAKQEFVWKTYTAVEALPITKKMEIIDKREFAAAALNTDNEIFVVHIVTLAE